MNETPNYFLRYFQGWKRAVAFFEAYQGSCLPQELVQQRIDKVIESNRLMFSMALVMNNERGFEIAYLCRGYLDGLDYLRNIKLPNLEG